MGQAKALVIAIDGPAGAGKSTVARLLAQRLGYTLLETGKLYRALAWLAIDKGIPLSNEEQVSRLAQTAVFELRPDAQGIHEININGRSPAAALRSATVAMGASLVSSYPEVRASLLGIQRELAARKGIVVEGRDIGTVVAPDADFKFFVTADPLTRARRRQAEDESRSEQEVLDEIEQRDRKDSSRIAAPLRQAPDAEVVDTTSLAVDEVIDRLIAKINQSSDGT